MECTRYASAREILRNSTFPRRAAKCESAICKQRIALSAENRCNQEKPSITSNGVMLGFFLSCFGAFLRIKPPVCRLLFFAILTRCPRFITTTVRFLDRNGHFSSYREKAREEKEGERRLWERCVNRLRFSTVSIAAAMARRFSHLGRSSNRNLDYFLDLFIQVLTL